MTTQGGGKMYLNVHLNPMISNVFPTQNTKSYNLLSFMVFRSQLHLIRNRSINIKRVNGSIFKILATRHLAVISQRSSFHSYTQQSVFKKDHYFRKMSAEVSAAQEDGPVYFWKPEQEDGYLGQCEYGKACNICDPFFSFL